MLRPQPLWACWVLGQKKRGKFSVVSYIFQATAPNLKGESEVVRTARRELQASGLAGSLPLGLGKLQRALSNLWREESLGATCGCTTHMSPKQLSLRATCILVLLLTSQLCALRQASVPSSLPGTDQHLFVAFLSGLGQGEAWLGYIWESA